MHDSPKLIRMSDAARARGVTRAAVGDAVRRNRLTVKEVAGVRFVVMDARYDEWVARPPTRGAFNPETARAAGRAGKGVPRKRKSPE